MDLKLFIVKDSLVDISKISGEYQRSDNSDGLGEEFSFNIALNKKDKYWPTFNIEMGDKILFVKDSKSTFTGMITEDSCTDDTVHSIKAYDYGFLMNKSQVYVQFRKLAADACIEKLCVDYSVPIGSICSMPTPIDKVYNGDTVSDCFKDIISQAEADSGEKYRMEIRGGLLFVETESSLVIKATYKGADNIEPFDITKEIANLTVTRSIADMRNSVKIISSSEQSAQVIGEASASDSVAKFGLLQHVETLSGDDVSKAKNEAKNRLASLNKVGESITLKLMGDDAVRSGRILEFNEPQIKGQYMVSNCTHYYSNNSHTMDVTLEVI